MIKINNKSECCGCFACKNICPRNAILMIEDDKGFKYPSINHNSCINCGLCEKVCPIKADIREKKTLPKSYAAINIEENIRMKSSSGGIFSLIAEHIINNDGIVFGAAFNDKFLVEHIKINNIEYISKVRGSKYIQSDINYTYKEAKKYLEAGKKVLFTGTPCQIEGLQKYLLKEYENLYTQDLICHGVPSKKVWKKYLEYRKKEDKDNIQDIYFRSKENKGWNEYQVLFKYQNKNKYIDHLKDIFMRIFLSDIALRDSCYNCKFKKKNRNSDITLADFWGINEILPSMNDEKGTSLLIVNSKKGERILNQIKESIILKEVDFEQSIKNNKSMIKSSEINNNTKEFFKDLEKLNLDELVFKYIQE